MSVEWVRRRQDQAWARHRLDLRLACARRRLDMSQACTRRRLECWRRAHGVNPRKRRLPRASDEDNHTDQSDLLCLQCGAEFGGFRCRPGAAHLQCNGCGGMMPSRPNTSIPQKCLGCDMAFCGAYWCSQGMSSNQHNKICDQETFKMISQRHTSIVPDTVHGGNQYEKDITERCIQQSGKALQAIISEWIAKFDNEELGRRTHDGSTTWLEQAVRATWLEQAVRAAWLERRARGVAGRWRLDKRQLEACRVRVGVGAGWWRARRRWLAACACASASGSGGVRVRVGAGWWRARRRRALAACASASASAQAGGVRVGAGWRPARARRRRALAACACASALAGGVRVGAGSGGVRLCAGSGGVRLCAACPNPGGAHKCQNKKRLTGSNPNRLDRSRLQLNHADAITSRTYVCNHCYNKFIDFLLYWFRVSMPRNLLPPDAANRESCWYGFMCRTQHHRHDHAKKLNHWTDAVAGMATLSAGRVHR
ncbi:hypothetical protein GUJ93_ZPchr0011g28015 [Zizania palustris]|uniref:E3 ubiquitin-protein ligase CHFR cysteine rich domain-containing protein n=1 Tax=Zizania palustris TaxID=103762 RepID=A0A8J5WGY7_ZIZPA|nr:hypothetical protein GUJ93_ZPchr0011g28015 [Zizania palustris]